MLAFCYCCTTGRTCTFYTYIESQYGYIYGVPERNGETIRPDTWSVPKTKMHLSSAVVWMWSVCVHVVDAYLNVIFRTYFPFRFFLGTLLYSDTKADKLYILFRNIPSKISPIPDIVYYLTTYPYRLLIFICCAFQEGS